MTLNNWVQAMPVRPFLFFLSQRTSAPDPESYAERSNQWERHYTLP